MTLAEIFDAAEQAGARLSFMDGGRVQVAGSEGAIRALLPAIRANKDGVLEELLTRCPKPDLLGVHWVLGRNGSDMPLAVWPPSNLADMQLRYPGYSVRGLTAPDLAADLQFERDFINW